MRRFAHPASSRAPAKSRIARGGHGGQRVRRGPLPHRRAARWRGRAGWPLALAMLMPAAPVQAAAYLPGGAEPDPPTGDRASATAPNPEEPTAGNGIRWELAPWRQRGLLSLDLRTQRLGDGPRSNQAVLFGEVDFASYIWQPWFIQLRAGFGAVVSSERSSQDAFSDHSNSQSLNGRLAVSVFPASRFPFEFRADASDSRTRGDNLGSDYRSRRLSLSQGWRPQVGNHHVQLNFDHSELITTDGVSDTLNALVASSTHQWGLHAVELGASFSDNQRSDSAEQSRLGALSARHSYQPSADLRVESMATENDSRVRNAAGGESLSNLRQLSSLLSWRPREGQWLHRSDAPLQVTGSLRWAEFGTESGSSHASAQSFNATLGATQEWLRVWRLSASASLARFESDGADAVSSGTLGATLSWTPVVPSGTGWQYVPSANANASLTRSSNDARRHSLGLQAAHSLSRNIVFGDSDSLTLSLTQSAAGLRESRSAELTTGLAHSASAFWQSWANSTSQTLAGLTLSDSITHGEERGRFQLVNLQLSRRTQLSRNSSWSANLTLQASRNEASEIDPFSGDRRTLAPGWQQFHSGSINYENQRVFGVPRLRFSLLLSANSQQLERRASGDLDAPLERVSRSLEGRLDYSIGRLDARLAARHAEVDGKSVSTLQARVQRRF